jgi:hypothetical protein
VVTLVATERSRSETDSLAQSKSKDPLRPRPDAERDAELDQALRELADELLSQAIPERLLRVLRSAEEAEESEADGQRGDPTERDRRYKRGWQNR